MEKSVRIWTEQDTKLAKEYLEKIESGQEKPITITGSLEELLDNPTEQGIIK